MSKLILECVELIRNNSSLKTKESILNENKEIPYLKDVLYFALSPRVNFYIKRQDIFDQHSINPTSDITDVIELLDKLSTGNYRGSDGINMITTLSSELDFETLELFKRILNKDLRFSMGTTLINKVFPKLIEETPYMGCKPFSMKLANKLFDNSENVISEVKMDGQYINAILIDGNVTFESRQGEVNLFPNAKFEQELKTIAGDYVFNGELTIEGENNRHIANGIVRSLVDYYSKMDSRSDLENEKKLKKFIKERGCEPKDYLDKITATIWDVISYDDYLNGSSLTPRSERLGNVLVLCENFERVKPIEYKMVSNLSEALSHYYEIVNSGGEGTVIKDFGGAWKDGKPTWQLKIKPEMTFDLEIVGFNFGTNKNEGIVSSLQVKTSDGLLTTNPTGMSEKMMKEITENQEFYLNKIIEIKCNGISQNSKGEYSLAHPVVLFLREDKSVANTLSECIEISNSIING